MQVQIVVVGGDEQDQQPRRILGEDLRPRDREAPLFDQEAGCIQLLRAAGQQARKSPCKPLGLLLLTRLQLGRDGAGQGADVPGVQEIGGA